MFKLFTRVRPGWLAASAFASAQQMTHCGGDSKHALVTSHREQQAKKEQYAAALAWCTEKEKGAFAAVNAKDADGKAVWPLISRTSLQRRIDGDTEWQEPHASSRTLTTKEEDNLVKVCTERAAGRGARACRAHASARPARAARRGAHRAGQGNNRGYVHSLTDLRIEGSGFLGEIEMFALKVAYELMV